MKYLLFISLLFAGFAANAQNNPNPFQPLPDKNAPVTFRNPIIPGFHSDPSVCRVFWLNNFV